MLKYLRTCVKHREATCAKHRESEVFFPYKLNQQLTS